MTKDESILQELMRVRVERNDYQEALEKIRNGNGIGIYMSGVTAQRIANGVLERYND